MVVADYIVCGSCKQDFPLDKMSSFIEHKKQDCLPGKSLACQFCQKDFKSAYSLLQHFQEAHSLKIFTEKTPPAPVTTSRVAVNASAKENQLPPLNGSTIIIPDNLLAFGNSVNTSWFAGGESVIPALNLVHDNSPQATEQNEQLLSPNRIRNIEIITSPVPSTSSQGGGQRSILPNIRGLPQDFVTTNASDQSGLPSPQSPIQQGLDRIEVPGAGCGGKCKCGCKNNCKYSEQSATSTSTNATANNTSMNQNAKADTGNICQCNKQSCGTTVIPLTHESMKKCCTEVVPKKRKRHMESHVPASFLKKLPGRKRKGSRTSSPRIPGTPKAHMLGLDADMTQGSGDDSAAPRRTTASQPHDDVDLLLGHESPFLSHVPASQPAEDSSILEPLNQHGAQSYRSSVSQNITSQPSTGGCCGSKKTTTSVAPSVENDTSIILNHLTDMELPILADALAESDALITSITNSPPFVEIARAELNNEQIEHQVSNIPSSAGNSNIIFTSINTVANTETSSPVPIEINPQTEKPLGELLVRSLDGFAQKVNEGHEVKHAVTAEFAASGARRRQYPTSRPFKCDICGKGFNQRIHLQKHKAKHTGIKPYKCDQCDYSTVERSHLKVHMRVHTGEKPFKCQFCDYATAQNSTLRIHLKRRHGAKLEEPTVFR